MTTRPPSPISTISAFPSRSRRDRLAARRLQHLTASLSTSWDELDERAREALLQDIRRAVDELASSTYPSDPGLARDADPLRFLTPRERQILDGLAEGASTPKLAARLGLSTSTVQSYVKAVLSKLGVHSRLEAVVLLLESGNAAERAPAGRGSERRHG
jgi:DNA-binding NarL/FixJ family response regulator